MVIPRLVKKTKGKYASSLHSTESPDKLIPSGPECFTYSASTKHPTIHVRAAFHITRAGREGVSFRFVIELLTSERRSGITSFPELCFTVSVSEISCSCDICHFPFPLLRTEGIPHRGPPKGASRWKAKHWFSYRFMTIVSTLIGKFYAIILIGKDHSHSHTRRHSTPLPRVRLHCRAGRVTITPEIFRSVQIRDPIWYIPPQSRCKNTFSTKKLVGHILMYFVMLL